MKSAYIQNERKQTLIFLSLAKKVEGVTLISKIRFDRGLLKYATASLIKSISMALVQFPALNCIVQYGTMSKLLYLDQVDARLVVAKNCRGVEGVYSFPIRNTEIKTVESIFNEIQEIKKTPLEQFPFYRQLQLLQRLPLFLGKLLMNLFLFKKENQAAFWGSFTVTSLGRNSHDVCIPISGSTFAFVLGSPKIMDDKQVECNLTMVFDHRVVDGLQASRVMNAIKENLISMQSGLQV